MQYKTGTVSVTNGSATVTGSGTLWLANLASGNLFTKEGDNVAYTIASVDSDTVIQLTAAYAGSTSSGSNYGVTIDFTPNGLPLLSPQDLNTAAINSEQMKNIDNSGSMTLGTAAQADIVGTVSESGGVPTGAIIETGTNANGKYTKWADGTMMCIKTVTVNDVVSTAFGSVFLSSLTASGAWAETFDTLDYTNISASRFGNAPIDFQVGAQVATNVNGASGWFVSAAIIAAPIDLTMQVIGWGRWF